MIIWRLLIVLVVFSANLSSISAEEGKSHILSDLYSNEKTYQYLLESNTRYIEWELTDSNGYTVLSGFEDTEHETDEYHTYPLQIKFPEEQTYNLSYFLLDSVYNKSNEYKQKVVFDATAPILEVNATFLCGEYLCAKVRVNEIAKVFADDIKLTEIERGEVEIKLSSQKWRENRDYRFQLHATDRAGNKSKQVKVEIKTPNFSAGSGEVYGADKDNPWGANNDYKDEVVTMDLIIDSSSAENRYWFEGINIPAPTLTYTETHKNNVHLYGQALSKSNQLQVSIYRKLPSYYQAQDRCRSGNPLRKILRPVSDKAKKCLEKELHVNDIDNYISSLQLTCSNRLNPFLRQRCVFNKLNKSEKKFYRHITTDVDHIKLRLFSNLGERSIILWQESDTRFQIESDQLKPGDYAQIRASIYGDFKVDAKTYNYRKKESWKREDGKGLESLLSNPLKVKKANLDNRGKANNKCNNQACKVLDVNYINQAVDENGKWEFWQGWQRLAGGQSCGAVSSVMVNDYFKKLPADDHRLKSFVFQDNGEELAQKRCNKQGAFAVTAYNSSCNQSSLVGIKNYLRQYDLKADVFWPKRSNQQQFVTETIKAAIDANKPIILSYRRPIGHILVVKGYTYGNHLVVNDPYRDIQNNYIKAKYDYSGKDAIYSLFPNSKFEVNYLIVVSR